MSGATEAQGLRFAGYAAIFGQVDRGGDVIAPGAFADSLARLGEPLPLLWQHDAGQPIGVVEAVREDGRGLRVIGRLIPRAGIAARAAAQVRAGHIDGLSFGYRVVEARPGPPRRLDRLDIVEISLVAHPMQPLARVHAVEARPGGDAQGRSILAEGPYFSGAALQGQAPPFFVHSKQET